MTYIYIYAGQHERTIVFLFFIISMALFTELCLLERKEDGFGFIVVTWNVIISLT